ncbi:hypothetical protein [Ralstonia pseudosolanacearum]|uniref:hypothetical protein n=1 Tax=Ralstonia TaxID=48736 RepID=UPI0013C30F29|nr:hypothetical protein [Ralstonia pseudosolanacearum]BEU51384.1 hypothetical protein MAFF211520_16760 [Ralstonia pseudosolanacearum]BEU56625.1 hypothetical protein MAFF211521_16780 [Ralstonia pseudosolanacearum]BEU62690.1 hypothetical protein MAFF301524_24900 [Ralstonia pseudosolanacearum]
MSSLRILTYKRTHIGDPDWTGQFGVNDCMGAVRNRRFDAVIGVGGMGPEPQSCGIAGKLTWVGVGPRRRQGGKDWRGDIVSFKQFMLLDAKGPDFRRIAPNLARRLFDGGARALLDGYTRIEFQEALAIVTQVQKLSVGASRSTVVATFGRASRPCRARLRTCPPRRVTCTAKICD